MKTSRALLAAVALAGCAPRPQLTMLNPRTGVTVGCPVPERAGSSGAFLVTRACLSACSAHGFRPVPGAQRSGFGDDTPAACLD